MKLHTPFLFVVPLTYPLLHSGITFPQAMVMAPQTLLSRLRTSCLSLVILLL